MSNHALTSADNIVISHAINGLAGHVDHTVMGNLKGGGDRNQEVGNKLGPDGGRRYGRQRCDFIGVVKG